MSNISKHGGFDKNGNIIRIEGLTQDEYESLNGIIDTFIKVRSMSVADCEKEKEEEEEHKCKLCNHPIDGEYYVLETDDGELEFDCQTCIYNYLKLSHIYNGFVDKNKYKVVSRIDDVKDVIVLLPSLNEVDDSTYVKEIIAKDIFRFFGYDKELSQENSIAIVLIEHMDGSFTTKTYTYYYTDN